MSEKIVVLAGDKQYFIPLLVSLQSIAEQTLTDPVVVLDCGLSNMQREILSHTASERIDVRFIPLTGCLLESLPAPICGSWAAYARLLLGDLFPRSSTILYLDADTLAVRSITPLLYSETGDAPVAAVREMYTPTFGSQNGVSDCTQRGIDPSTPYFNAGVLLINGLVWNQLSIKDRAIAYLREPGRVTNLFDQEALNVAINGSWHELPAIWNVTRYWYRPERRTGVFRTILEDARIFHFLSEDKPWIDPERLPAPQVRMFFDMLDRTKLAGWRPDGWNESVSLGTTL